MSALINGSVAASAEVTAEVSVRVPAAMSTEDVVAALWLAMVRQDEVREEPGTDGGRTVSARVCLDKEGDDLAGTRQAIADLVAEAPRFTDVEILRSCVSDLIAPLMGVDR